MWWETGQKAKAITRVKLCKVSLVLKTQIWGKWKLKNDSNYTFSEDLI